MERRQVLNGFAIVVADRGFVFVGNVEIVNEWCIISDCKNIRYWGTTAGLGELAEKGPLERTKLDVYHTVRVPMNSVVCMIDSEGSKWR